ncbi:rRNA methyltransferase 1, mitochondrial [Pezoporus flaviventris]|uniref:rRNA methyltransferase 1, mitochondrial n=1 Tax=Pezoporus flaviventris TaxID=889875 RepID=UPI002AB06C3E|nr:rRNA methyltransferase 1, mitochondrial [Pezoporus flaviventris]
MPCGPPVRSLPPPGGAAAAGGSPRLGGAIMCPPGSGAGLCGVGAAAAVGAGLGALPRCPWVPVPRGRAFGAPMELTARVWRAAGLSPAHCGLWWRGLRGCSAKGGPEAAPGPVGGGGRLHPSALPRACRASSTSSEGLVPQSQPRPGHRSKDRGAMLAAPAAGELWNSREGGLWKVRKRMDRKPLVIARTKGSEILFGISPCSLALSQSRRDLFRLFLKQSSGSRQFLMSEFALQATARGVPVHYVNRKQLDALCRGQVHQGVCLEATPLRFKSLEEAEKPDLRDEESLNRQLLWLVLEQIQDPMNLGALLRSAYFLGVDRVVTSRRNSCPLTPTVSKASSGAMEVLDVYSTDDLQSFLKAKAAEGWEVLGTVSKPEDAENIPVISCSEFQWNKPVIIVIGSEGDGLSLETQLLCHRMLAIPPGRALHPGIESLNVSVATGILLHSICSQKLRHGD